MKLKIEVSFRDKYTDKKYKVGEEVEFEDERAKELLSDKRGLVTEVKDEPKKPAEKKSVKKSKK